MGESSLNAFESQSSDSKQVLNQMNQLKTDLTKSKVQLEHLSELLNESELNNNRLSEQINLLKEEIRRLERNQEREKSISNMEYLKNVVFYKSIENMIKSALFYYSTWLYLLQSINNYFYIQCETSRW